MFLGGLWRFFLEGSRGSGPPPDKPAILTARVRFLRRRFYPGSGVETSFRWVLVRPAFRTGSGVGALSSWRLGPAPRGIRFVGAPAITRWALGVLAPTPVHRLAVGPRWSLGSLRFTPGSGRNRAVGWLLGTAQGPQPVRPPSSADRHRLGHTRFTPGSGRPSIHWWIGLELRGMVFDSPQANGGWSMGRPAPAPPPIDGGQPSGWRLGRPDSPNTRPSVRALPRWLLGR